MKKILILALLFFVAACTEQSIRPDTQSIVQSPNDHRQYEYLVLPNQMKVLLVSDPEADKAAASLTVGVGSTANPEDRAGLAHFLEHMLFMGTEKYPGVDEYAAFIDKHGGSHNAFTASNITTYFFNIKHAELEPGLDRFAQFFIAPLFAEKYVEREKNAVHSEYQLKLKDDNRRIYAAQQKALNPQSPYAKFSVGNLDTLADRDGDKVRDDLLAFYKQYYSANQMTLAVLGREPLSELRKWVKEKFSQVPNNNSDRFVAKAPLFTAEQLPVQMNVVPLKEIHKLELEFPITSTLTQYRTNPTGYLAHFIGHEGKGSLFSLLKSKGWVTSLSASGSALDIEHGLFNIAMELTPEGLAHRNDIVANLFAYIRLLDQQGIQDWRYAEQHRKSALAFQFKEKIASSYYVMRLSGDLQKYPKVDILRATGMKEEYDPAIIKQIVAQLVPENLAMISISPSLQTTNVEPLYNVSYSIQPIATAQVNAWKTAALVPALALPDVNPFIPDAVALKPVAKIQAIPEKLQGDISFPMWFQQDDSFGVPKAGISFVFESPVASDTLQHYLLKSLLLDMLKQQLNEYAYPARVAGLHYSLSGRAKGMNITLFGYDQKQSVLLEKIIDAMMNPQLDAEMFEIRKARLHRKLKNLSLDRPYKQILGERKRFLISPSWSPVEKTQALEKIQLADLQQYAALFFTRLQVTGLAYGNHTAQETLALAQLLDNKLLAGVQTAQVADPKLHILDAGKIVQLEYAVDHPDSVVVHYFQGQGKAIEELAKWKLLGQLMSNPFFSELRTEQQLGYVVSTAAVEDEYVPGMIQLVQSSAVSATELQQRIDTFTQEFSAVLSAMSADDFSRNKAGLIADLLKKDKAYLNRTMRYLSNLQRKNYSFDFKQKLATAVEGVTQETLLDFYKSRILSNGREAVIYSKGGKN